MDSLESPLMTHHILDDAVRSRTAVDTIVRPDAAEARSSTWRLVADAGPFLRHYGEMVLAMMVGMMFPGMPLRSLLVMAGFGGVVASGAFGSLVAMWLGMTASMVAWMRYRGHTWRQAAEMTVAMLAPALLLVALDRSLAGPSHLAMLLGMLGLMLYRHEEYGHGAAHATEEHHAH